MTKRLEFHDALVDILGIEDNVYFQPPENFAVGFPCIVYSYTKPTINRADNQVYRMTETFMVTVIDKEPEGEIWKAIIHRFPQTIFDRTFPSGGSYHTILTIRLS
jgi:hypothetical protein